VDRFYRQILLPEIGLVNQLVIQKSCIIIVGVGGLGCPVALYLAAAGIKNIILIDADTVSLDNLNRQVLFGVDDIGKNKAIRAAQKLNAQFNDIQATGIDNQLTEDNAAQLLEKADLIIDCSDNFLCRYATTQAAETLQKTILTGSIYRNEGQIICLNNREEGYKSYSNIFPEEITKLNSNNCEEAGVLGATAGLIGSVLSIETINQIIGKPGKLVNEMIIFNQYEYSMLKIKI